MGLVIITMTLAISIGTVMFAVSYAKRNGKSTSRWGWGVATLMIFLIATPISHWPTIPAHKFYCARDSGYWIYKPFEKWKAENPNEFDTKEGYHLLSFEMDTTSWDGSVSTYAVGKRILVIRKAMRHGPRWLLISKLENEVIDKKNNEVLSRYVDFSSGVTLWPGTGNWLRQGNCEGGSENSLRDARFIN